jgi:hypothetical protein
MWSSEGVIARRYKVGKSLTAVHQATPQQIIELCTERRSCGVHCAHLLKLAQNRPQLLLGAPPSSSPSSPVYQKVTHISEQSLTIPVPLHVPFNSTVFFSLSPRCCSESALRRTGGRPLRAATDALVATGGVWREGRTGECRSGRQFGEQMKNAYLAKHSLTTATQR